jgi:6-phosphogluconolactonase (cycloisomerase 2 family)
VFVNKVKRSHISVRACGVYLRISPKRLADLLLIWTVEESDQQTTIAE